jgi:hypothetical protein
MKGNDSGPVRGLSVAVFRYRKRADKRSKPMMPPKHSPSDRKAMPVVPQAERPPHRRGAPW